MMSNEDRAGYGYAAIEKGTPDFGKNSDFEGDPEGAFTDAGDTICNVLHYLFQVSKEASLDKREEFALDVLRRGEMHFKAELRGGL